MSLTKEQLVQAIAHMCNMQDSDWRACPAEHIFKVKCPFCQRLCETAPIETLNKQWAAVLNSSPAGPSKYKVKVTVTGYKIIEVEALSPDSACDVAKRQLSLDIEGHVSLKDIKYFAMPVEDEQ